MQQRRRVNWKIECLMAAVLLVPAAQAKARVATEAGTNSAPTKPISAVVIGLGLGLFGTGQRKRRKKT